MLLKEGLCNYTIEINKCSLFFRCKFDPDANEMIIFIHGLACSSDSFRDVFTADNFPGKSVLAVDLLGFGNSDKPEDFSYTMQDQATIIEELISLLPANKLHIVAHSMGGAVALLLKHELLSSLVSFVNVEGNLIAEDCGIMSRGIIDVSFERYRDSMYLKHVYTFRGHHQLRFEESSPLAIYNSSRSLVEWSDSGKLLEIFKALTCKKCYFFGEENKGMPVLEKLDFVPQYMISKSGHGMMTENPEEFYGKLSEFINP